MPDSLYFDGSDDQLSFSAGDFAGTGARTHAVVFKKAVDTAWQNLLHTDGTTGAWVMLASDDRMIIGIDGGSDNTFNSGYFQIADGWCLAAITKAAGSDVGDWHRYEWGSGWLHEVGTVAQGNLSGTSSHHFGAFFNDPGYGTYFTGNILIGAVWDSELSEANVETLTSGLQAWIDLAPDELWRLDRISGISSLTGSSTETSRTGTTVDTGDAPSGWSDALTGTPNLYVVRSSQRW